MVKIMHNMHRIFVTYAEEKNIGKEIALGQKFL